MSPSIQDHFNILLDIRDRITKLESTVAILSAHDQRLNKLDERLKPLESLKSNIVAIGAFMSFVLAGAWAIFKSLLGWSK